MELFEAIHTRRSVRQYLDKPVPEELVKELLAAAMAAPSACNAQPWQFIVVTDREILKQVPAIAPYAAMAKHAPLGILVCGDTRVEISPGYWVVDCAAAVQNMLLAAHTLGLGAVWTGVHPQQEKVKAFSRMMGTPAHVIPHSFVVLGYPAEHPAPEDRYRPERVRRDRW
jgi:nitroreductase